MKKIVAALLILALSVAGMAQTSPGHITRSLGTIAQHFLFSPDNTYDIGAVAGTRPRTGYFATSISTATAVLSGKVTTYNNVATAGWGVPAIQAAGRATAQTAANASVATYTVGAADGTFEISANVLVTTATTHTFNVECAYTDEGNTARTITIPFVLVAGSAIVTSVANGNGAVPYIGLQMHIRAKASTAITIRTQAAGTYTTVTYNVEGSIRQIA